MAGGFTKPIKVGEFIHSHVSDGSELWAYDLYSMYKKTAQDIPRLHLRDRVGIKGMKGRGIITDIDWDHRTAVVERGKLEQTRPFSEIISKRPKRKVCSYHSFLTYLYMLRRLGLIEYVMEDSEIAGDEPLDKGGNPAPHLAKTHKFRMGPADWKAALSRKYGFQAAYRDII